MTWLQDLVKQHEELESPKNFWYWAGLCAISAVVKDQVYLDRYAYKLYPNIYVMLHADSGLKKGPPVSLAKNLVKRINNTRIISGRSSIQGILKELGTAHTIPGGRVIAKSVGFIVASEFSSSLVSDPAAMTILTDLYDRNYNEGEYRSLLKMDTFSLRDPTITMLVATNKAHFEDFIESKDVQGGFIGRMFIIAETQVHQLNPLGAPLSTDIDIDKLLDHLKQVSNLNGPFKPLGSRIQSDEYSHEKVQSKQIVYMSDTGALYHDWYIDFYESIVAQRVDDPTGTIQRFGDSVIKVAMLLSLSESTNLIISPKHMREAIDVCERLIGNVRKTTHGKAKGEVTNTKRKDLAIFELMNRDPPSISRLQLLKKYWMQGNADEWDQCIVSLQEAGLIRIDTIGNQIVYTIPDKQFQEMKRFLAGKSS